MRLKVLIVDREQFEADLLDRLVTEYGHNCTITLKAAEAVALVADHHTKNTPFDLVFTEFMLDGTTGIDLCRKLRAIDPSLTLVIITSDNSTETKIKIAKSGDFSGFISKTSEITNVKHHLDIAMSNKKAKMSGEKSVYLKQESPKRPKKSK